MVFGLTEVDQVWWFRHNAKFWDNLNFLYTEDFSYTKESEVWVKEN